MTALYGLTNVGGDVEIRYNRVLTNEAGRALVDEIDAIGGRVTVISNN